MKHLGGGEDRLCQRAFIQYLQSTFNTSHNILNSQFLKYNSDSFAYIFQFFMKGSEFWIPSVLDNISQQKICTNQEVNRQSTFQVDAH